VGYAVCGVYRTHVFPPYGGRVRFVLLDSACCRRLADAGPSMVWRWFGACRLPVSHAMRTRHCACLRTAALRACLYSYLRRAYLSSRGWIAFCRCLTWVRASFPGLLNSAACMWLRDGRFVTDLCMLVTHCLLARAYPVLPRGRKWRLLLPLAVAAAARDRALWCTASAHSRITCPCWVFRHVTPSLQLANAVLRLLWSVRVFAPACA